MPKQFVSRRQLLFEAGGGLSGLALAYLLDREDLLAAQSAGESRQTPLAPGKPHFAPRAKP